MKVNLQTTKFNTATYLKRNTVPQKQNGNPINFSNRTELPSDYSAGRSLISFKGTIDIDSLEEKKKKIQEKRDDAQAKLNKANNWLSYFEKEKAENEAEEEIKKQGLSWYNWSKKSDIRDRYLNRYYEKNAEIQRIESKRFEYQEIIDACNLALAEKSDEITIGKIYNESNAAQNAINNMLNGEAGLNNRIAGYGTEKSKITRILIDPVQKSKNNPKVKVPSAIMLYGATGTGKTTFLEAVKDEAVDVRIDDMTEELNSSKLKRDFQRKLETARQKYLETYKDENGEEHQKRTRTLLLINEAEKILAMTPEYAKEHLDKALTDSDYALLESYKKDTNLNDNVNFFKRFLDHCSKVPGDKNDKDRGALTVFITTNYPHLIHPDLLTRDGKLTNIAINPANGANIEAVVKHYAKLNEEALEAAKNISDDTGIDMLSGLSEKAKEKLKEYRKNGRLDELQINAESIPYEKITMMCKPTDKMGAYSNDGYRKISEDTFLNYLENPETPYYTHLIKTLMRAKRDIDPVRFIEFKRIDRMLSPIELNEREELINLEKSEALDEKYKGRLEYIRLIEQSEIANLTAKQQLGQISEDEIKRLKEIEEYQRLDNLSFEEYCIERNGITDEDE